MPSMYSTGSYAELERALAEMREGHRQLWWHVNQRYRFGQRRLMMAPLRKTRTGLQFMLPPRTERISSSLFPVGKTSLIYVYQWSDQVRPDLVKQGVTALTQTMYSGDTQRIVLPVLLLKQRLGLAVEAAA